MYKYFVLYNKFKKIFIDMKKDSKDEVNMIDINDVLYTMDNAEKECNLLSEPYIVIHNSSDSQSNDTTIPITNVETNFLQYGNKILANILNESISNTVFHLDSVDDINKFRVVVIDKIGDSKSLGQYIDEDNKNYVSILGSINDLDLKYISTNIDTVFLVILNNSVDYDGIIKNVNSNVKKIFLLTSL